MFIILSRSRFSAYRIFIARAWLFPGSSLGCPETFEEWLESSVLTVLGPIEKIKYVSGARLFESWAKLHTSLLCL